MKFFNFIAVLDFYVLFQLQVVNGAPAVNNAQLVSSTKKISTTALKTTTSAKSSTITPKSTAKVSSVLSSTATYPAPTVPIGAGGGPFATRQGRLFQIQSKTQYFAGIVPPK